MGLNKQIPDDTRSDVIHLGSNGGSARWSLYLVTFMRVTAAIWLVQGLMQWHLILVPQASALDAKSSLEAAAVVFFAVTNLLAGVGLWLAVPWGGVIWLFAVSAQMFMIGFVPGLIGGGRLMLALDVALVVSYFVLSWYAAQERDAF
jgi:hypothetical protein